MKNNSHVIWNLNEKNIVFTVTKEKTQSKSLLSIENLNYLDTPDPTPKNDEILIKVRAIGVNFADSLLGS